MIEREGGLSTQEEASSYLRTHMSKETRKLLERCFELNLTQAGLIFYESQEDETNKTAKLVLKYNKSIYSDIHKLSIKVTTSNLDILEERQIVSRLSGILDSSADSHKEATVDRRTDGEFITVSVDDGHVTRDISISPFVEPPSPVQNLIGTWVGDMNCGGVGPLSLRLSIDSISNQVVEGVIRYVERQEGGRSGSFNVLGRLDSRIRNIEFDECTNRISPLGCNTYTSKLLGENRDEMSIEALANHGDGSPQSITQFCEPATLVIHR